MIREDVDVSRWIKVENESIESDVWEFEKPKNNKTHPTMKPVSLCERAILNSSLPNNIVLDSFLGSGSTLIACQKSKRRCYGLELDPKYIDVIIKRYEDYTGNKAVKVN